MIRVGDVGGKIYIDDFLFLIIGIVWCTAKKGKKEMVCTEGKLGRTRVPEFIIYYRGVTN